MNIQIVKLKTEKDRWLVEDFEQIENHRQGKGNFTFRKIGKDGYNQLESVFYMVPPENLEYAREKMGWDDDLV